jgi:hypothetical protein
MLEDEGILDANILSRLVTLERNIVRKIVLHKIPVVKFSIFCCYE